MLELMTMESSHLAVKMFSQHVMIEQRVYSRAARE